jgi:hypothetical protein
MQSERVRVRSRGIVLIIKICGVPPVPRRGSRLVSRLFPMACRESFFPGNASALREPTLRFRQRWIYEIWWPGDSRRSTISLNPCRPRSGFSDGGNEASHCAGGSHSNHALPQNCVILGFFTFSWKGKGSPTLASTIVSIFPKAAIKCRAPSQSRLALSTYSQRWGRPALPTAR